MSCQRSRSPIPASGSNLKERLANLEGAGAWPYTYNHGLAMTSDGRHLVAVATVANYAAIYSLPDFSLKGTVPVGGSPNWVVCDPEGKFAYVSNPKDNSVSVIDIAAVREVAAYSGRQGAKARRFQRRVNRDGVLFPARAQSIHHPDRAAAGE